MSDGTDDPMEALVGIVAVATLPLTALASIFVGETAAGVVAIVGWLFLVPVLAVLEDHVDLASLLDRGESADATPATDAEESDDALQRLRERYAAGEVDDVEFERRLERLLETEGIEVPDHVDLDRTAGAGADVSAERERETEREAE
ncbi:MAG: SHOCT domain-containing protein [Halosimplex sp.]